MKTMISRLIGKSMIRQAQISYSIHEKYYELRSVYTCIVLFFSLDLQDNGKQI